MLTDALAEPLQRFKADGLIDRWFFIRYGDPDWHLLPVVEVETAGEWRELLARPERLRPIWNSLWMATAATAGAVAP